MRLEQDSYNPIPIKIKILFNDIKKYKGNVAYQK